MILKAAPEKGRLLGFMPCPFIKLQVHIVVDWQSRLLYFYAMAKKLFLLDAFALVFRAYYALIRNPRITSKGRNTNAQFGSTNTNIELTKNQNPTHMAVCFDTHAPTERHTDFADYKANRQETPEDILSAVPDIKRIIEALNIPVFAIDGYEADDVIGK